LIIKILSFIILPILFSGQGFSWWMWTPGDHVADSTQSLLVKGYHPDQPIPFSHKIHAGDRNISCQYCHTGARRSTSAGFPTLETCMGCHTTVRTESPHIKYLSKKYKNNEPVVWTRVHNEPDYVRFSHKVHIHAKDSEGKNMLSCENCHGDMKKQSTAEHWLPGQMGWCIECHTKKHTNKDGSLGKPYASIECSTCHY
jgi:hypothetical protein